jgi:hypothetical protein
MTIVTVAAGWILALKLNYFIWKVVRRVTKEKWKKIYLGDVKARWFSQPGALKIEPLLFCVLEIAPTLARDTK